MPHPKLFSLVILLTATAACAGSGMRKPTLAPLALAERPRQAPQPLKEDLFKRDHAGSIGEAELQRVLDAPVELEAGARVGVVPVRSGYGPDGDLPLEVVPEALAGAVEATGLFDGVTEVSTDWPNHGNLPGLRELAARYRSEYLLLYRHRFASDSYANPWSWFWLTVVGGFFAPVTTLESAGVLEASLFDVRTGTILFTAFARVDGETDENLWGTDRKQRALQERLLKKATEDLSNVVVAKLRALQAASGEAVAIAPAVPHD